MEPDSHALALKNLKDDEFTSSFIIANVLSDFGVVISVTIPAPPQSCKMD